MKPATDLTGAIEVLNDLRAAIESGQVVCFAAVGIQPNDVLSYWSASTRPVTNLRLIGACSSLAHKINTDTS